MPSKKSKGSKDSKRSKGKGSSEQNEALEQLLFGRKRYDNLDSIFIKKSKNMVVFAPKIHIYEIWNQLQPGPNSAKDVHSFNKSPKNSKGSKSPPKSKGSKSSKSSRKIAAEEKQSKPEYEKATLMGAVAVPGNLLRPGDKIFVEVTANFIYYAHSKTPPYQQSIVAKVRCFRDFYFIFPYNFTRPTPFSVFTQDMMIKIHDEYPKGWGCYPFFFDLTRAPDSLFFNRHFYTNSSSGVIWSFRAYAAKEEYCVCPPENQVTLNFFKYTLTPVLQPSMQRPMVFREYTRYPCIGDFGILRLSAQLDRDVYYQGDEVNVNVIISNDSARHIISTVSVCIEQKCSLLSTIPHEFYVPVAEVIIGSGEFGLPIRPKNKAWSKSFSLRPMYNRHRYNLAIDGRMRRDKKIFLAQSTVIMKKTMVKVENPYIGQKSSNGGKSPPKNSPKKSKGSPKSSKKSPKSSKGKGLSKGSKESSKGTKQKKEEVAEEPKPLEIVMEEVNELVDNQACRNVVISYDVVVRCSLGTPYGDEGSGPIVRVPFILSRNSRFLDKLNVKMPPIFALESLH